MKELQCAICQCKLKEKERNSILPLKVHNKTLYCCDACNVHFIVPMRFEYERGNKFYYQLLLNDLKIHFEK